MVGSSLSNSPITLHSAVATLDGTGGASIVAWQDGDGYRPSDAFLRFTNNGTQAVQIANVSTPAQLYVDGLLAARLFEGHQVTIDAGSSVWCAVPRHVTVLGNVWSVLAPMSSGAVISVTVTARHVVTSAPTASAVASAVLREVVSTHSSVAGSLAEALIVLKGLSNGNTVHDQHTYDGDNRLTSCRIRVYPTGADAVALTNVVATFTVTVTNGASGPTSYRVAQS